MNAPAISRLMENLAAGRRQTVVVYGTSLTEGGRWVGDLTDWLDGQYPGRATIINSGQSGRASNTALANLEPRVLAHRPDTVILEFAINDAFGYEPGDLDHGISEEKSRANLNQMIDAIRRADPDAEIILQTMNPAWDAPNGNRSGSRRPRLDDYYTGCRAVASARGLPLVDHHANWSRLMAEDRAAFERHIPDGVHPTPEGSTTVTFPALRQALAGPVRHPAQIDFLSS